MINRAQFTDDGFPVKGINDYTDGFLPKKGWTMGTNHHAVPGTYEPAIDGLRFFAFMLVFIHHAPLLANIAGAAWLKAYGWVGVDLFFTLSAYLLFRNLIREDEKSRAIDVPNFLARRLLRVFPLLLLYVGSMLLLFDPGSPDWPLRLAGTLLFFDNVVAWFHGYNGAVVATAHLWTLSFEFQFYVLLPLIFMGYKVAGKRRFLTASLLICLAAALARHVLYQFGVGHPVVYVTPFMRPEAIIAGIAVAIYKSPRSCGWSAAASIFAGGAAFTLPLAWQDPIAAVVQYPLIAIAFAGLLDLALRWEKLRVALSAKPIVYLGTISYGLYVFHFGVRHILRLINKEFGLSLSAVPFALTMLALSVFLASLSYRFVEKPFLRWKLKLHSKALTN